MKKIQNRLFHRVLRTTLLFVLVNLASFSFAQEKVFNFTTNEHIKLSNVYPADKTEVMPSEQLTAFSFDKKTREVYVFNENHIGTFTTSESFGKQISKAKVKNLFKKDRQSFDAQYAAAKKKIDRHYFVLDSIAKEIERLRVLEEQRKQKEQREKDSLAWIKKIQEDSIYEAETEARNQRKMKIIGSKLPQMLNKFKSGAPVRININNWYRQEYTDEIVVECSVINCSTSSIKYISFNFYFTNPVGDVTTSFGRKFLKVRGVGPIGPRPTSVNNLADRIESCFGSYTFDDTSFYPSLPDEIHLSSVSIIYMNGKTQNLSGAVLRRLVTYYGSEDYMTAPENPIYVDMSEIDQINAEQKAADELHKKNVEALTKTSEDDNTFITWRMSPDGKIYEVVEKMPSFPGGNGALMNWLASNISYPAVAAENGIEGRVIVSFVVERDGSITDVHTVRSVDPSLDREAESVVGRMPRWTPGFQDGEAVRVKYNVPVTFRLQK